MKIRAKGSAFCYIVMLPAIKPLPLWFVRKSLQAVKMYKNIADYF